MKLSKKVCVVLAVAAMMTTTVAGASVDWKVTATSSYGTDIVTARKEVSSHSYATITRTSGTLTEQARTPLLAYVQAENFSQYKSEVV